LYFPIRLDASESDDLFARAKDEELPGFEMLVIEPETLDTGLNERHIRGGRFIDTDAVELEHEITYSLMSSPLTSISYL
jgi:hypothetical protein